MGGLGNQMFQYAAGLRLAVRHHTTLKLDLTLLLDRTPNDSTFREFDLEIFGISGPVATSEEVRRFRQLADRRSWTLMEKVSYHLGRDRYYRESRCSFQPAVLNLPGRTYLEGYFQDERYFLDIAPIVRKQFCLAPDEARLSIATRKLAEAIRSSDSICVHVRRGDYVANPVSKRAHGCCSLEYFRRALVELRSRAAYGKVFIFSDDVGWCRERFSSSEAIVVGEEYADPHAHTHFWLMTLCKHFVISNSTFSWWAAWLARGTDSIICSPVPWFEEPQYSAMEICPSSWLRIPKS
jgi:hypothetical protein